MPGGQFSGNLRFVIGDCRIGAGAEEILGLEPHLDENLSPGVRVQPQNLPHPLQTGWALARIFEHLPAEEIPHLRDHRHPQALAEHIGLRVLVQVGFVDRFVGLTIHQGDNLEARRETAVGRVPFPRQLASTEFCSVGLIAEGYQG